MIYWEDERANDGTFVLVIHPNRILLQSAHNNPNPNFVYWYADISTEQYEGLCRGLGQYKGRIFADERTLNCPGYKVYELSKYSKAPWKTERNRKTWILECARVVAENLNSILTELNRVMPPGATPLRKPYWTELIGFNATLITR